MSSLLNSIRGGAAPTGTVNVTQIRKEGWVMKESATLRQYRKRWLVLTSDRLCTFKKEGVYIDPTEEVDLRHCGTVKSADDLTNRPYSFTGARSALPPRRRAVPAQEGVPSLTASSVSAHAQCKCRSAPSTSSRALTPSATSGSQR